MPSERHPALMRAVLGRGEVGIPREVTLELAHEG